jgi:hypothetical protein
MELYLHASDTLSLRRVSFLHIYVCKHLLLYAKKCKQKKRIANKKTFRGNNLNENTAISILVMRIRTPLQAPAVSQHLIRREPQQAPTVSQQIIRRKPLHAPSVPAPNKKKTTAGT